MAHAGQQGVVLHGHRDLVGHQLGEADKARLENALAVLVEQVKPAQTPSVVVGKPQSDQLGGAEVRVLA